MPWKHDFIPWISEQQLPAELVKSHQAEVASQLLDELRNSINQPTLFLSEFRKDEHVLYFKRCPKFVKWEKAFASEVTDQFLALPTSQTYRGNPSCADYEEVRRIVHVFLLKELHEYEFLFFRSNSIAAWVPDIVLDEEMLDALLDPEVDEEHKRDEQFLKGHEKCVHYENIGLPFVKLEDNPDLLDSL